MDIGFAPFLRLRHRYGLCCRQSTAGSSRYNAPEALSSSVEGASKPSPSRSKRKLEQSNRFLGAPDLSGIWEIHEEDKTYVATLDRGGNGTYTWQNGRIVTTQFDNRKWEGTWHQTGNDSEGGFEVLLSQDSKEAKGVWWYTRVGDRENIPPRRWGGSYHWNRMSPIQSAE